jgi:riboflavin synthase
MFTGIVEERGEVSALKKDKATGVWRLSIRARLVAVGVHVGDSIAVNGCCLTVVEANVPAALSLAATEIARVLGITDPAKIAAATADVARVLPTTLVFDVLDETLKKTSFRLLRAGSPVNLERALLPTTRMGGHFVSGHVDCAGEVVFFGPDGANHRLTIRPPAEFLKYAAYKGSIAVDGISLTLAAVDDAAGLFHIYIIPHTIEVTNLEKRRAGDPVNLEFDLLAKYVEKLTTATIASAVLSDVACGSVPVYGKGASHATASSKQPPIAARQRQKLTTTSA